MSEFGRGYATCLRQFANHRARLQETLDLYFEMRRKHVDGFTEASAVEIWAHGASDHLAEFVIPAQGVSDDEVERARRMADRVWAIGHDYLGRRWKSSALEAVVLLQEAEALLAALEVPTLYLEDAMAADRALGLEPDAGTWDCPLDLRRDQMVPLR